MTSNSRPLGVTLVALFFLLLALERFGISIALLVSGIDVSISWIEYSGDTYGYAAIVGGVINLIIALGLFKGWRLWWYLGLIFAILGIINGLIIFPYGVLAIIISVIIIWYMFRPNVKEFFLN